MAKKYSSSNVPPGTDLMAPATRRACTRARHWSWREGSVLFGRVHGCEPSGPTQRAVGATMHPHLIHIFFLLLFVPRTCNDPVKHICTRQIKHPPFPVDGLPNISIDRTNLHFIIISLNFRCTSVALPFAFHFIHDIFCTLK